MARYAGMLGSFSRGNLCSDLFFPKKKMTKVNGEAERFFYFLVVRSISLKRLTIRRLCDWAEVLFEMF